MKKIMIYFLMLLGAPIVVSASLPNLTHEKELAVNVLERNKQNVIEFYDLMFNKNKPDQAIAKYVGDTYIQHNPHVKDGKDGFIEYFRRMAKEYPGKKVTFKKIIAENNFVVLHCLQEWPGDKNYAGIDIFRLSESGKILEHWDVLQVTPPGSKNGNSMF
ncbi:nuclear transport factor 2 family protein [Legionella israelensis]|uniref:nuclear transport factor 2 family protein n=1 Tax=Legionella israelensis TaxID=454 RepID=UPI001AD9EB56|nr:nuclear transport factor 2 family protein [Legionella israelensis]